MALLVRNPAVQVIVRNQRMNDILSASVTRGLDQDMAQGSIVIPYPIPTWLRQWDYCTIQLGASAPTAAVRLAGYIRDFDYTMWPGAVTLLVSDPLILAKYYYPQSDNIDFRGLTDAQIVRQVLGTVGIPFAYIGGIAGTGKVIAPSDDTVPLTWPVKQSALDLIKEIDSMSPGYRTFVDTLGVVRRLFFDTTPSASAPTHTFNEGTDIFTLTTSIAVREPNTEVTVEGDNITATISAVSHAGTFRRLPAPPIVLPWLRAIEPSPTQQSIKELGAYLLTQFNRNIVTSQLTTHRDDVLSLGETIVVNSLHGALNNKFWLQSIQTDIDESGAFTQQIGGISELSLGDRLPGISDPTQPISPIPAPPVTPAPPPTPPIEPPTGVIVSFTMGAVDEETVIDGGDSHKIYTVACVDTSSSVVAGVSTDSQEWSADGATPDSGTGPTFNPSFDDLDGAEITLTITDANGGTGSLTQAVSDSDAPHVIRKLYANTADTLYAFDGSAWNSAAAPGGAAECASGTNEGHWGCGSTVVSSDDDLASEPSLISPVMPEGETVTAIFTYDNGGTDWIFAGGNKGSVYLSSDSGDIWNLITGPHNTDMWPDEPIRLNRIAVKGTDANEVHVLTNEAWFVSFDGGQTYGTDEERGLDRDGSKSSYIDIDLGPLRNIVVTTWGQAIVAQSPRDSGLAVPLTGTPSVSPPTWPPEDPPPIPGASGTGIVCAAAHPIEDRFYAADVDGHTYIQEGVGLTVMVEGEPLPDSAVPAPAGMAADPILPDVVYIATDQGLYKTTDGFKSAAGYHKLAEQF